MFCDRCGTELQRDQNFCPKCGRAMGTPLAAPAPSRIGGHVRLLGILWLAISGIRLIPVKLTPAGKRARIAHSRLAAPLAIESALNSY